MKVGSEQRVVELDEAMRDQCSMHALRIVHQNVDVSETAGASGVEARNFRPFDDDERAVAALSNVLEEPNRV